MRLGARRVLHHVMSCTGVMAISGIYAPLSQHHVCITTMTPGERSEEAWLWHTAVCEAIQEIPHGKVTSYGHIAMLVGKRALSHRMTMASC